MVKTAGIKIADQNIEEPGISDEEPESFQERSIGLIGDEGKVGLHSEQNSPSQIRSLSVLQILSQVATIVFVRPDHNHFQILTNLAIREQVLGCFKLEFVYEDSSQVAFLFLPDVWVFRNSSYFLIQGVLLLL